MNLDTLRAYIDNYYPAWRLSDPVLFDILPRLLETYKPKRVLELGPGASSLVLLPWCLEHEVVYHGLDHIGPYHEKHLDVLRSAGLPTETTLAVSLSRDQWYAEWYAPWRYSPDGYGLILVDGPISGRDSVRARQVYRIWDSPETVWVFDDTHRKQEYAVSVAMAMSGSKGRQHIADPNFPPRMTTVLLP